MKVKHNKFWLTSDLHFWHKNICKYCNRPFETIEQMNEEILVNDKPLDIIYEDDYIIIINKENDISSQPSQKHPVHNVISCVKNYFIKKNINSNVVVINMNIIVLNKVSLNVSLI